MKNIIYLFLILTLLSCSEEDQIEEFNIISFTPTKALEGDRLKIIVDNLPQIKKNLILEVNGLEFPIEKIESDTLFAFIPVGASSGQLRLIYDSKDALSSNQLVINNFEILDFIPNVGFIDDIISISGNGFTTDKNLLSVDFNGTNAEILQSNETTILTKVPAGATTGRISITNNSTKITSTYDFKVVDNPNGGSNNALASIYLPQFTKTYLFDNWEYDEENNRTGVPVEDSTFIKNNVLFNSFQSLEYTSINKSNFQSSKKYYRSEGAILFADGASESQLPPIIAEQIGNDIQWVPILNLNLESWQVFQFDDVEFTLPINGQNINVNVSSQGTARRNLNTKSEIIAGQQMEIIEVEYTFTTNITITFGIIPIQQEIETKSIYWFAKDLGIVREINLNSDSQGGGGLPIGGGAPQSAGERILKKIYN